MNIAIINASTVVSDVQGSLIVQALNVILPKFCNDWNLAQYTVVYIPRNKTTEIVQKIFILDNSDLNIPGIIGYHDFNTNIPYGKCFAKTILNYGGTVLYSSDFSIPTIAQTITHEVFEMLFDPLCNTWWDTGDGKTLVASETVDAVQCNVVVVNVLVSPAKTLYNVKTRKTTVLSNAIYQKVGLCDWVLPSWSNPKGTGPFNHLNTLKAPFTLDKNGYIIKLTGGSSGNTVSLVFGSHVTEIQKQQYASKGRYSKWNK